MKPTPRTGRTRAAARPERWITTARALAFACAIVLALAASAARAQTPDPAEAAAADTGWVEIGGDSPASAAADSGFGADDPFADLPEPEEEDQAPAGGRVLPYFDFNRVDQWTLGLDLLYKPEAGWTPAMKLRVARAFQRKTAAGDGRTVYEMRFDQPVLGDRTLRVGFARYRKTDDDGFGQISGVENAVATAFFRWDFRDWFEREGFEAGIAADLGTHWTARARYNSDDYTSITELADGVALAFRQDQPLRENPAIDDGRIQAVTFGAGYDSRSNVKQPRSGMFHRVEFETAGGSLGGDYTYHRALGDFRVYISPSPSHRFKTRVMAGTSGEDDVLPLQRTFAIGGVGTMRASTFREFRGNRMFLWNADWAWEVLRRSSRNVAVKTGLSVVAFSDMGLAWDSPTWDIADRKLAWNVGLGLGTTDENFRVYFGRDVRADHAPVHCTVRLSRSY